MSFRTYILYFVTDINVKFYFIFCFFFKVSTGDNNNEFRTTFSTGNLVHEKKKNTMKYTIAEFPTSLILKNLKHTGKKKKKNYHIKESSRLYFLSRS